MARMKRYCHGHGNVSCKANILHIIYNIYNKRFLKLKLVCDRRAASANILASQSFTTGKHYWEVDVGGSQNWSVGVAVHNKIKNGVDYYLGNNKRSWVLESDEGDLRARHDNNVSIVKEASVQRLGVFVDCDKGRVRFYDVSTGNVLHTFIIRFKGAVCPAFSLRDQLLLLITHLMLQSPPIQLPFC
uniref:B30.2/SPRY domain-containing protein n=1 Tax=Electrophorus electricus TaxID=8005 RepID=A0A4W4E8Q1_ELEEL